MTRRLRSLASVRPSGGALRNPVLAAFVALAVVVVANGATQDDGATIS